MRFRNRAIASVTFMAAQVEKIDNGRVKIITGLRGSGKTYLLFSLFREYLLESGVGEDQIIGLSLDDADNAKYRNPFELNNLVKERIADKRKRYFVLIDEIQRVAEVPNPYVPDPSEKITFIDVVLGWMKIPNADVYVTGSYAKMLSKDVPTQFRDRGDEIRLHPLSYAEVYEHYQGDKRGAWRDYYTYGGMPLVWSMENPEEKRRYLRNLFSGTYIRDILERHRIKNDGEVLESLLGALAAGMGSLTNPRRISRIFASEQNLKVAPDTITAYLGYFLDAFLIQKADRYDVKRRKCMKTPVKYFFSDPGLRNAILGFSNLEEKRLMESILCNDLLRRGFDVDVGVVEQNTRDASGNNIRKQLEVDFVVNRGDERYYIQSALSIADPDKRKQEIASLIRIPDFFRKIVVVKDYIMPWQDDYGIRYVGIEDFLLDESLIAR